MRKCENIIISVVVVVVIIIIIIITLTPSAFSIPDGIGIVLVVQAHLIQLSYIVMLRRSYPWSSRLSRQLSPANKGQESPKAPLLFLIAPPSEAHFDGFPYFEMACFLDAPGMYYRVTY